VREKGDEIHILPLNLKIFSIPTAQIVIICTISIGPVAHTANVFIIWACKGSFGQEVCIEKENVRFRENTSGSCEDCQSISLPDLYKRLIP
jgi:hypothetical protein